MAATPRIRIKASHVGKLHESLGVPKGQKIPLSALYKAKASSSPAVRKRATFAMNARRWGGK